MTPSEQSPQPTPIDDVAQHRFVIKREGETAEAELVYRVDGHRLVLLHTGTPEEWRHQGVGGQLVEAAVARAGRDGLTVVPWCPFTRWWLHEHEDVAATVTIDWDSDPARLAKVCSHLDQVDPAPTPDPKAGCKECLAEGTKWVHLRLCLSCGHVGCCDNSPRRHATAHYTNEGHPVIRSYEPGEDWWWCYVDEAGFEIEGAPPAPSHP